MLKKEFRDILMPTLLRLSLLGIIPLLSLLSEFKYIDTDSYYRFLSGFLVVATIWIASTYGIDAFKYEHKDQALEYLLSFPLTKSRILLYKLIPRVSILMILIALILAANFKDSSKELAGKGVVFYVIAVLSPVCEVMFFLLAGFFVGMFFEHKRSRIYWHILAMLSMIAVSAGIQALLLSNPPIRQVFDISFSAGCLSVLAVLGTAFVSVYRKMDLKPARFHGRKFTLRALPPLMVLTTLIIVLVILYGKI